MSEDLIKRSDAIKAIWGDDINPSEDGMVFEAQSHIDRDIRLIPPADRPQGEWIEHEHGFWTFVNDKGERDGWIPDYECNLCGARAWKVKTKFCPTCGARMKGADDE